MGIKNFNQIVGQKKVKDYFKSTIDKDKLGHAYIIDGPVGMGKKTMSNALIGTLLCTRPRNGVFCGACRPCKTFINGSHPDYFLLDNPEKSISVNRIREIHKIIVSKPLYSSYKIIFIPEADKMTVQAQNALLRIFEEPPKHVKFILTVSKYNLLLETIRSRAIRITLVRYTDDEINNIVDENGGTDNTNFVLSYAAGIPGRAINFLNDESVYTLRNKCFQIISDSMESNNEDQLLFLDDFIKSIKDKVGMFLDILELIYRDMLIIGCGIEKNLINSDKSDIIIQGSKKLENHKIIEIIDYIESIRNKLGYNANYQLSIETLLIKMLTV